MGLTKQQMIEAMEQEEKQEFLHSLSEEKAEEIYNDIENEGFGEHEFLYVLCILLVGAGLTVGFTRDQILNGVESVFPPSPENLTTQ